MPLTSKCVSCINYERFTYPIFFMESLNFQLTALYDPFTSEFNEFILDKDYIYRIKHPATFTFCALSLALLCKLYYDYFM